MIHGWEAFDSDRKGCEAVLIFNLIPTEGIVYIGL